MSGLDFSTVIASTVHDMKNSLAMLGQAHAQWLAQLPVELQDGAQRGVIEYEFARLNGMLVQLLGLYKLGVNQLPMRPGYHEVEDFLQAQLARHDEVLRSRGIVARCEVAEFDLMGFGWKNRVVEDDRTEYDRAAGQAFREHRKFERAVRFVRGDGSRFRGLVRIEPYPEDPADLADGRHPLWFGSVVVVEELT